MNTEQLNGTTICHQETGHGEPLVLVHGGWVDQTTWDAVVPTLAKTFRVVRYDERGHGRSRLDPPDAGTVHDDVTDLAALIEHLDLEPVNVAGISSGACIALRLASEHPALVRRVLPHEPPCMQYLMADVENKPALDQFGETMTAVQHQIEAGDHRGAGERFFNTIVGHPWSELSASERDLIAAHAVPFLGQMHDPDAIALDPDALRSVSAPVLLSDGRQSPRLLRLIVDELATVMPSASRITIADAGHVPQMTHPDAYVEMVVQFIGST